MCGRRLKKSETDDDPHLKMAAWPPLQDAKAGEFWRQVIRKELSPWQADACRYSPKNQGKGKAAPKPTLYNHVYGAYSSKSTPPAHARTNQMASSWPATSHSSAPSLKVHVPSDAPSDTCTVGYHYLPVSTTYPTVRFGKLQTDGSRRPTPPERNYARNSTELQPSLGDPRPLHLGTKDKP